MVREEELDVIGTGGIYPKLMFQVVAAYGDTEWWTSFIYRNYMRGVKSIKFQKLVFILYLLHYPPSNGGIGGLEKEEELEMLEVEKIMDILNCSRESAKDYKNTLKAILRFFW